MKGKDLHEATFYRGRAPFYAVIGSMLFWGLLFIGWLHLRSMNNAMETKRDGDKNGALMTAKGADEYLWGSYRGNIYFGMRMAKPTAISTGMMWFGIRHECGVQDGLTWGWLEHDGTNYGKELLTDPANNVQLTVTFHKTSEHSWRANVVGVPLKINHTMTMSWLHYFTYNGPEETYEFDIQDSSKESFASGYTAETGNFTLNVKHSAADAHNAMLQVAPAKQWHIKDIVGKELIEAAKERVETEKDLSPRNLFILNGKKQEAANVVVTQLIFDKPFNIEIEYNGQLQHSRPNQVLADQSALSTLFNQRFDILFANTTQDVATLTMAKTAISNLMGGITYFYGRGIVYHWKDGHKTAVETEPFELITDTPSRTTFPRGFLWDSGFHNLVILKWNPLVSLRILTNWANRIDERGWVAREQIPGEEARSRVPADLRPQNPHFANPPGLLLPLMELVQSLQAETAYMKVISEILSHFERNFYWYIKTQHSQLHPSFMGDGDTSGLFRWRGRSRHHTLTSGLDDYPRGNTPNEYELHTDLATWMIFAARTLRHIKLVLGQNEGNARLQEIEMSTRHALETFHWNDQLGCYCDRTVDEHGNFVFVEHVGYVSIFPLLFGLVDHKSPHLNRLFDIIEDEKQLWTLFGIRSLSASDSFYMKGDQYWTGPIWVNINYLLLGSLKLNYMAEECPYHDRARLIYDRLRTNLIDNMTNQYMKSGFIWEQYDDVDGHGKRSHPFTGWSALITLVITEQYPSSLKA